MKPVFASNILLSIVLPLCGNLSAQENGHNQTDNSRKEIKMSVTQKQVNVHGIAIFQFKNDRIIRSWNEVDRLGFHQQIGVIPQDL